MAIEPDKAQSEIIAERNAVAKLGIADRVRDSRKRTVWHEGLGKILGVHPTTSSRPPDEVVKMNPEALEEHLFRAAAGRLVSILTALFGVQNLDLAEDVVQGAFCRALETWKFHSVPKNPTPWLMTMAKHRALDILRRQGTARRFAPELGQFLEFRVDARSPRR